jgi:hypothetical protein
MQSIKTKTLLVDLIIWFGTWILGVIGVALMLQVGRVERFYLYLEIS